MPTTCQKQASVVGDNGSNTMITVQWCKCLVQITWSWEVPSDSSVTQLAVIKLLMTSTGINKDQQFSQTRELVLWWARRPHSEYWWVCWWLTVARWKMLVHTAAKRPLETQLLLTFIFLTVSCIAYLRLYSADYTRDRLAAGHLGVSDGQSASASASSDILMLCYHDYKMQMSPSCLRTISWRFQILCRFAVGPVDTAARQ